jgi:hypothetical protein
MSLAVQPKESLPVAVEGASLLAVIERAAANPDVDVDKMERLMNMARTVKADQAKAAFNGALARVQSHTTRVSRDATNPQTRSQYATYAALDRALRPLYTEEGFAVSFDTGKDAAPETVEVLGYLSHRDGHTHTYRVLMPADGKGAKGGDVMTKTHAAGAAMSYGMRYLLKLMFNVAVGEDDRDGNTAPVETIGPGQEANLVALLDETKGDESLAVVKARFLKWAKVDSLDQIGVAAYSDCVKAIERKRSR